MKVDRPACVFKIVDSVVNVDAMVLVSQISLKLVSALLVVPQLVVDLLQGLGHPCLALLDLVHLPHQGVLHPIPNQINLFPSLSEATDDTHSIFSS